MPLAVKDTSERQKGCERMPRRLAGEREDLEDAEGDAGMENSDTTVWGSPAEGLRIHPPPLQDKVS